jgi:hypothetical protein
MRRAREVMNSAARPMGMFSQKIQRQPGPSVKNPPSSGPATLETPNTAPNMPWYFPRSRGGMMSPMMASASAMSPPPPRPCTARPPMSISIDCAAPAMSEPSRKMMMASWNIGRRPRRSEILPHRGVDAVEVSR